jgi:perosamine synthetase
MRLINVGKPVIGFSEWFYVSRAILTSQISGYSKQFVPRFESEFAKYIGVDHGVAVNSGTSAINLALSALDIGTGDEVLISSYTNMATFFPVLQLGAMPIPVDVDPIHFNFDPSGLEKLITEKTKAILVVHIFGHPAPMDEICEIANRYGIPIIEDCAEAHGATIRGKKVGSFGIAGCFSFYANKLITTGEGGMLTTNDSEFAFKAKTISSLSFGTVNKFLHEQDGYNFRLSNILAGVGIAQLKRLESNIKKKRRIAKYYKRYLNSDSRMMLPSEEFEVRSVYWMFLISIKNSDKYPTRKIIEDLKKHGIESREGFVPFSDQEKVLKKFGISCRSTPVASTAGNSTFYLPSGPNLSRRKIRHISKTLIEILDFFELKE